MKKNNWYNTVCIILIISALSCGCYCTRAYMVKHSSFPTWIFAPIIAQIMLEDDPLVWTERPVGNTSTEADNAYWLVRLSQVISYLNDNSSNSSNSRITDLGLRLLKLVKFK